MNKLKSDILRRIEHFSKRFKADPMELVTKLVASLGLLCVVTNLCATLLSYMREYTTGEPRPVLSAAHVMLICGLGFFAGFVIQGLVLLVFGRVQARDYSWEDTVQYFALRHALPTYVLLWFLSRFVHVYYFGYFTELMRQNIIPSFDEYSAQPYMCAGCFLLAGAAGVWAQFMPFNRIATFQRVMFGAGVCFFCTLLSLGLSFTGVLFTIYVMCAAVAMNQAFISRAYHGITVTRLNATSRFYNMKMVLLVVVIALAAGAVVYVLLSGIWYILRFLLVMLIIMIAQRNIGSSRPEEAAGQVSSYVFENNDPAFGFAYIVTTILFAVTVLILLIAYRSEMVQSFLRFLRSIFEAFVRLFMGEEYEVETEINYKDEVINVVPAGKSRKVQLRRGKTTTYRDFESALAALTSDDERLTYSYTVMIDLLGELNGLFKISDTPRELESKIEQSMTLDAIGEITDALELVKYAERSNSPEVTARVLGEIRRIVERRLT